MKSGFVLFIVIISLCIFTACLLNEDAVTTEGSAGCEQAAEKNTSEDFTEYSSSSGLRDRAGEDDFEINTIESIINENNQTEYFISYKGVDYGYRNNISSYLIMGVDRFGEPSLDGDYIETGQADCLYVIVIDDASEEYSVLQLNRDAMADIDILGIFGDCVGTERMQLCLAHAYGDGMELSCLNTVNAVSKYLCGARLDGYAAFQFDALPVINDDVGGVEVHIEDDFSMIDETLVLNSDVKLMGQHALNFVQSRLNVSDGTNTARMRRQRVYLSSLKTQFESEFAKSSSIVNKIYNDVQPYVCTDMSLGLISDIAVKSAKYKYNGISTIDGITRLVSYENGNTWYQFETDESSLYEIVISLFCVERK